MNNSQNVLDLTVAQQDYNNMTNTRNIEGLLNAFHQVLRAPKESTLTWAEGKDLEYLLECLYEVLPDGNLLVRIETTMFALKAELDRVYDGDLPAFDLPRIKKLAA